MRTKQFILSPFFLSLSLGVLTWFLVFLITPASPVFPMSTEALLYIILCYACLILGYLIIPSTKKIHSIELGVSLRFIWMIVFAAVLGFVLRYFDLFVLRGVSLGNSISENRDLIDSNPSSGIFILASVLRYLFFVPLVLVLKGRIKHKGIWIACVLLFLIPFLEGAIRGSRNSFFYPSILLILIAIYFGKIKWNLRHLGILGTSIIILFIIATTVLKKREIRSDKDYEILTSKAIYNDFLKPKESVINYIHESKSTTSKQLMISGLQIGQYYTHGVFEFDHLMKTYESEEKFVHQNGKYNFMNYVKLTNKYGITNSSLPEIKSANPRGYSFITHFGGIYIDFGWFGLLFMFVLGVLQKWLFNRVKEEKVVFLPLFLFFIFMNFFMLTFNFLRNTGVSIITVNIMFILSYYLVSKYKILKS